MVCSSTPGTRASNASVLPPLKPSQPKNSSSAPSIASGRLPAGITGGGPSAGKRPALGPMRITTSSATQPPTLCTTVDPAKSTKPSSASQPRAPGSHAPPQAQWPNTGYTTSDTQADSARYAPKRMRSATAPETMVAAVAQNMIWNSTKASSRGSSGSWPARPNRPVPIQPATLGPNIRPKPTAQNRSAATAKSDRFFAATLIEFLVRVSPDSRHRKPACITKTSPAHSSTHSRSTMADIGVPSGREATPPDGGRAAKGVPGGGTSCGRGGAGGARRIRRPALRTGAPPWCAAGEARPPGGQPSITNGARRKPRNRARPPRTGGSLNA